MKNKIIVLLFSFFIISCSKGYWTSQATYRAKRPNYSLLKESYTPSNKVVFNKIYLSASTLNNFDGTKLTSAIGFYPDGRFVLNGYDYQKRYSENENKNTWKTAQEVGYYRINNDKIRVEFFTSSGSGLYIIWNGTIKHDSIIFDIKNWPNKDKESIYILSDLSLK